MKPALRNEGGGTRYYHRNGQYSIIALTNVGGSIVERYAYTAYGQVTFADASGTVQAASASNNRYTYTGREWDGGLGLYHFRARMYDPVAGRFVSRDPIGHVDGASLYRLYIRVVHTDPTGTQSLAVGVGVGVGVGQTLGGVWGVALAEPTPVGEVIAAGVTIGIVTVVAADAALNCLCKRRHPTYRKCKTLDQTTDPVAALKASMRAVAGWSGP